MKGLNLAFVVTSSVFGITVLTSCGQQVPSTVELEPVNETVTIEVSDTLAHDNPMTPEIEESENARFIYIDVAVPTVTVNFDENTATLSTNRWWTADLDDPTLASWCSDGLKISAQQLAQDEAREQHFAELGAIKYLKNSRTPEQYVREQLHMCPTGKVESEIGTK